MSSTILGIPITTVVFGIAFVAVIFVLFLFISNGPTQLMDLGFGILGQGVASAGLAFNTLLSASAPLLSQGLEVAGTLVEQAGFVADTVIQEAGLIINQTLSTVGEFIAVEGALIASSVITLSASVVTLVLNITTAITVTGAEIANVFLGAAQATTQFFLSLGVAGAQTASMLIETLVNSAAQIFTTAFTSVAGVVGQLFTIVLVLFNGTLVIASEFTNVGIYLGVATVDAFITLFNALVSIFTDPKKFIGILKELVEKIGQEIVKGFNQLVRAVPDAFKQVFSA